MTRRAVFRDDVTGALDAHAKAADVDIVDAGNHYTATDVEGALQEAATLGGGAVSSVFTRTGAVAAASGDYNAGQITNTPAGGIASTDVQAALNELDTEKLGTGATAADATKLATARNIDGQAFDGTADITVIAPGTHAATSKTTPVDADELPLVDSAASNVLKKLTWANLKATAKTYFDTLYDATGAAAAAQAASQPLDATLTALAGLATGADQMPYSTGTDAFSQTALSSFIRTLLDDSSASVARTTLGIPTAVGGVEWTVIVKANDTSRNAVTVVSADPELQFTATSGGLYEYLAYVIYLSASGGGTPDIKFGYGEDNTARGLEYTACFSSADAAAGQTVLGQQNSGHIAGTAATNRALLTFGWHLGNGGTFAFAWAQNTSSGSPNDTTVKAASILAYRRRL